MRKIRLLVKTKSKKYPIIIGSNIINQIDYLLKSNNISEIINSFLDDLIKNLSDEKEIYVRENQIEAFKKKIKPILGRSFKDEELTNIINLKKEIFENEIKQKSSEFRNKRIKMITENMNLEIEKKIFLQTVDFLWRSHLQYLEHLRQVVGLRGYAQKDPLQEYKKEAFNLFKDLLSKIKTDFITFINNLEIVDKEEILQEKTKKTEKKVPELSRKMGRNEPCYCGSGKKYKHCCGSL